MAEDSTPPGDATAPPPPPAPLIVGDPVLMETLAALDRDVTGETNFCVQAVDALQAFQARWSGDLAVVDAYQDAIRTLALLPGVLAGAHSRTTQTLTQQALTQQAAAQRAQTAQTAREQAVAWAGGSA